ALDPQSTKFDPHSGQTQMGTVSGLNFSPSGMGSVEVTVHFGLSPDEQIFILVAPPIHGRLDVPVVPNFGKSNRRVTGLYLLVLIDICGAGVNPMGSEF